MQKEQRPPVTTKRIPTHFDAKFLLGQLFGIDYSIGKAWKRKLPEAESKANHPTDEDTESTQQSTQLGQQAAEGPPKPQAQKPKYKKKARRYELTKCLIIASVNGIKRLVTQGLVPKDWEAEVLGAEQDQTATNVVEVGLLGKLLGSMGYPCNPEQARQAWQEGESMHTRVLTMNATTRKVVWKEAYAIGGGGNLSSSQEAKLLLTDFHERSARSWFVEQKDPFESFQFTFPPSRLTQCKRQTCGDCNRSAHLYCPRCKVATLPPAFQVPPVALPVNVDIIHHPQENTNKSTSIHACVLSPAHCRMLEFPKGVPEYDPSETVLLYPTEDATFMEDVKPESLRNIKRILVIESTWQKGQVVAAHPHLKALRKIRIRNRESTFWRYQELGNQFLSTLEAIYYTQIDFYNAAHASEEKKEETAVQAYNGQFDDLMLFYAHNHALIAQRYAEPTDNDARAKKRIPPRSWKPLTLDQEAD